MLPKVFGIQHSMFVVCESCYRFAAPHFSRPLVFSLVWGVCVCKGLSCSLRVLVFLKPHLQSTVAQFCETFNWGPNPLRTQPPWQLSSHFELAYLNTSMVHNACLKGHLPCSPGFACTICIKSSTLSIQGVFRCWLWVYPRVA